MLYIYAWPPMHGLIFIMLINLQGNGAQIDYKFVFVTSRWPPLYVIGLQTELSTMCMWLFLLWGLSLASAYKDMRNLWNILSNF